MAEPNLNLNIHQNVSPQVLQRAILVGRVKIAQAIKMPESEWAKLISDVEKDSLFKDLLDARAEGRRIIKFKRFARTDISNQFYDTQEMNVVGGNGVSPETLLEQKKHLIELINRIGQEKFEKYFLFREESDNLQGIAGICGVSEEEAKEVQDFIVDMSVQAEFYHPSHLNSSEIARPTLVGQIVHNDDNTFSISFFSPHLARGLYDIDRDALRRWQKSKKLNREQAARLRRYIGVLELSNLKQGAFWRVVDHLLKAQKEYFLTRDETKMAPVSLRKVAKILQFAPSTLSRVLASKSVLLPWNKEVMLLHLLPGQRSVVLNIVEKIISGSPKHFTDQNIARLIEEKFGVKVSRRTVTACRHVIQSRKMAA